MFRLKFLMRILLTGLYTYYILGDFNVESKSPVCDHLRDKGYFSCFEVCPPTYESPTLSDSGPGSSGGGEVGVRTYASGEASPTSTNDLTLPKPSYTPSFSPSFDQLVEDNIVDDTLRVKDILAQYKLPHEYYHSPSTTSTTNGDTACTTTAYNTQDHEYNHYSNTSHDSDSKLTNPVPTPSTPITDAHTLYVQKTIETLRKNRALLRIPPFVSHYNHQQEAVGVDHIFIKPEVSLSPPLHSSLASHSSIGSTQSSSNSGSIIGGKYLSKSTISHGGDLPATAAHIKASTLIPHPEGASSDDLHITLDALPPLTEPGAESISGSSGDVTGNLTRPADYEPEPMEADLATDVDHTQETSSSGSSNSSSGSGSGSVYSTSTNSKDDLLQPYELYSPPSSTITATATTARRVVTKRDIEAMSITELLQIPYTAPTPPSTSTSPNTTSSSNSTASNLIKTDLNTPKNHIFIAKSTVLPTSLSFNVWHSCFEISDHRPVCASLVLAERKDQPGPV